MFFFDFLFIYVLQKGVFGAALATIVSQVIGVSVLFIYFRRENTCILKLIKTKVDLKVVAKACINGSSEMVTNFSTSLVSMLYNMQLLKYAGNEGVIAYGVIMYIGYVFSGIYLGYSVGTAPIIGYHHGAKNKDELKNLLSKSLNILLTIALVMTMLTETFSENLASIFVSYDEELLQMTTGAIRIFAISYLMSGINIFASSFFTALNNEVVSGIISFGRTLILQISMIFILPLVWGVTGIWLAVVVAEIIAIFISIMFLSSNRKKYEYF